MRTIPLRHGWMIPDDIWDKQFAGDFLNRRDEYAFYRAGKDWRSIRSTKNGKVSDDKKCIEIQQDKA